MQPPKRHTRGRYARSTTHAPKRSSKVSGFAQGGPRFARVDSTHGKRSTRKLKCSELVKRAAVAARQDRPYRSKNLERGHRSWHHALQTDRTELRRGCSGKRAGVTSGDWLPSQTPGVRTSGSFHAALRPSHESSPAWCVAALRPPVGRGLFGPAVPITRPGSRYAPDEVVSRWEVPAGRMSTVQTTQCPHQ